MKTVECCDDRPSKKEILENLRKKRTQEIKEPKNIQTPEYISEESKKKHGFSEDFVLSQKYYVDNYQNIVSKYKNKWLIISREGVQCESDDLESIHNIFLSKGFANNAILTKAEYQTKNM